MADGFQMQLNFGKVPDNKDLFEFTVTSPLLRCQFRVPREVINKLRVDMEQALLS